MAGEGTYHHCLGCGAARPRVERYPWHFCSDCLGLCEDGDGQPLRFSNVSLSGGLQWQRAGDAAWNPALQVACLIKGRPVLVTEARFGGVVAQPMMNDCAARLPDHTVDLRRKHPG